jgi:hypothetical protein
MLAPLGFCASKFVIKGGGIEGDVGGVEARAALVGGGD